MALRKSPLACHGRLVAALALAQLLVGCERSQPEAATPTEPQQTARWIEATPEAVAQGKVRFGTCMGCHGQDAGGRIGIGPRLASDSYLAAASDEFLFQTIKNGRAETTMVPWGNAFTDDQIENLVAYLRSLNPVEPATLDESDLTGNPERGAEIFANICAGCHGRSGAGYQETANGTGIGRKAFLASASDGFIRYIVKHGKTLTKMRGFSKENVTAIANLDDQQIDDTIAYLRLNAW
jgi:cbb3-type cytochrome c oxidase subunit III